MNTVKRLRDKHKPDGKRTISAAILFIPRKQHEYLYGSFEVFMLKYN